MAYLVVHKLTNKPIRRLQEPHDVLIFESHEEAYIRMELKNEFMKANFYKVVRSDEYEQTS